MAERPIRRVIATEAADQSEAICFLPGDHPGPCALSYRGRTGVDWAIFATLREGERAAAFAIRLDIGGFSDVEVHPKEAAPIGTPTYDDAWSWLDCDQSPNVTAARDDLRLVAKTNEKALMPVQACKN